METMEGTTHVVTINEALSYIKSLPNNTKETPYNIKITEGNWENYDHFDKLKSCCKVANKFVDLGNTTFSGTFDNFYEFFKGCTSLTKAPVIPEGAVVMQECFYGCINLTEPPVIPESVTNMNSCFYSCESLTQVPVIPKGVTAMNSCFSGCRNITKPPVIPEGVKQINQLFYVCKKLTQAPVIPESVSSMWYTFYGCISLTQAPVIPESVNAMPSCFDGCVNLVKAPIIPERVTLMKNCFKNCNKIQQFIVPIRKDITDTMHLVEILYHSETKILEVLKDTIPIGSTEIPENINELETAGNYCYLVGNNLTKDDKRRLAIQNCLSTIYEGIQRIRRIKNAVIVGTKDKTNTLIKGVHL